MLKEAMHDKSDLMRRLEDENERKKDFIDSLKKQIKDKEFQKRRIREQEEMEDQHRPNYIFDD